MQAPDEIVVATYNVETLFDCAKDEGTLDHDYLPHGHYAWTPDKLAMKIDNIRRVVATMNGGRGPDVLALNEVENRGVVEQLRDALGREAFVTLAHHEGDCQYGLENAVISKFPLAAEPRIHHLSCRRTHPAWRMRGILEVELDLGGAPLVVFSNHWPAGVGRSAAQRLDAARQLRALVEKRATEDPLAKMIVVGDFNANPSDEAFGARGLGVSMDVGRMGKGATLYNTMAFARSAATPAALDAQLRADLCGTHFTRPPPYDGPDGEWNVLDQILVSAGLMEEERLWWVRGSTRVVREGFMLAEDGTPRGFFERGVKPRHQALERTGFSDHLPVVTHLRRARD